MEFQENLNCKWRWELFRICVVLAGIGTVTEIVIYWYDSTHSTLFLPLALYRARFIYIPTSMNIIVILLTAMFLKTKKLSNRAKNTWACILIYFLCANTQCIHYVYGPLLMLPCIAIFVSILFADKVLTICITIASMVSLMIATKQASIELRKDDPQLVVDTILAFLVFSVSFVAARLLTDYVSQQMNYILNSNARQKELIEECNLDPLLGINNRRALEEELPRLYEENREDTALIMLDIDDFKKVNDTYGHLCGDEVLLRLVEIIKNKTYPLRAYRYGGEELVITIWQINREKALEKCEEIRKEFEQSRYEFAPKLKVTFSAGVVFFQKEVASKDWLIQADKLMYHVIKGKKLYYSRNIKKRTVGVDSDGFFTL